MIKHSCLDQQFADFNWNLLRDIVAKGDFTLGNAVQEFEQNFANLIGTKHAIGVGSGTDAIKLSLRACGVQPGDEVITSGNTFFATVGAICELGAKPVFVDCDDTFCMDPMDIEDQINWNTTAIVPVHLTGYVCNMLDIMGIAKKAGLSVVEDACQAVGAPGAGTWGRANAFSLHPLKNLNVWGDGGVITTNDDSLAEDLRLLRNHGLKDRDTVIRLGYNSRLDSIQAAVGNWMLPKLPETIHIRRDNAAFLDYGFHDIKQIRIPQRPVTRSTFHLYVIFAEQRDYLLAHCQANSIDAKVHYPIPAYRQPALGPPSRVLPNVDRHAREMITLPCHQYLTDADREHVVQTVRSFYGS